MSALREISFPITLVSGDGNTNSGQGGNSEERDPLEGFDSQQRGWIIYERVRAERGDYDDDGARSHQRVDDNRQGENR